MTVYILIAVVVTGLGSNDIKIDIDPQTFRDKDLCLQIRDTIRKSTASSGNRIYAQCYKKVVK